MDCARGSSALNERLSSHLISSHLISSHLISSHLISSHLDDRGLKLNSTMWEHMPAFGLCIRPKPRQDGQSETTSALLFWALLAALWTSGSANSKSSWTGQELMAHPDTALILLRFCLGWREIRYHARTSSVPQKMQSPCGIIQVAITQEAWLRASLDQKKVVSASQIPRCRCCQSENRHSCTGSVALTARCENRSLKDGSSCMW